MKRYRTPLRFAKSTVPWLAVLVMVASAGCGRRSAPHPSTVAEPTEPTNVAGSSNLPVPGSAATPTAGAARDASIPLEWLSLPGDRLVTEATGSEWDSESWGQAAASQLKALGNVIRTSRGREAEGFRQFVAEDFRCTPLRPKVLQVAFQDPQLRVARGTISSAFLDLQGADALAHAIRQMLPAGINVEDATLRFEQKVVRVNVTDEQIATLSLIQLFAETTTVSLQQNMTWQCTWQRATDGQLQLHTMRSRDFEEVQAETSQVGFAEVTQSAIGGTDTYREVLAHGIDYWIERLEGRFGIFPTAWHGMAIGDVNNDGLEDIYICEPGGLSNALFVRLADGTAEDRASEAGVDLRDQTHSALLVDLDNDNDQDLVLGTLVGVLMFANDGQGRFSHRTTKYTPDGMPFSLSAADFDADGDLDLYACCYSRRHGVVSNPFVGMEGRPIPYHDANNGARNLLLLNDGSWRFPDVTQRVGLGQNNRRFSFAAAWEDYDNDGDQDLYVANDYGRNNLFRNDDGRFVDVARAAGVEDISAGMSVSWGDVDNDGWMDLYVANMFSSAGNRVAFQRRFLSSADSSTRAEFQRHARGNSLFRNAGDGSFRDVSQSSSVTMGRWAWGSPLIDLNHDGRKDIISTNGFLTQELEDDL